MSAPPKTPAVSAPPRITALDFTKGALVLFMALYHWLNYFVSPQGDFYKYLRFVTPSFIFISGFLISNVYLSKYQVADPRLPRRLLSRGLKILGVFVFLNVVAGSLFARSYGGARILDQFSTEHLMAVYVTGNTVVTNGKVAAFYILVPISYLLVLSAALSLLCRFSSYVFHAACALSFLGVAILRLNGFESPNLELVAIGLLGAVVGYTPIDKINGFVKHRYILATAYVCYIGAITLWNVTYPLLIVGVCLSVMAIYLAGMEGREPGATRACVILLGKYSLVGYIAQIAILQLLYRIALYTSIGPTASLGLSFLAVFVLTVATIKMLDSARTKAVAVDRLYRAVFA